MYQCERCKEPLDDCVCPDVIDHPSVWEVPFGQRRSMWYIFVITFPTFFFWMTVLYLILK